MIVYWSFFIIGIYLFTSSLPAIVGIGWLSIIIAAAGVIGYAHGHFVAGKEMNDQDSKLAR